MFARKKARVDWKSVQDAFTKPRRLHLEKGSDGVHHCPVTGCEHTGFSSQRGCRKHVKTKHGWFYYFDEKPNVCDSSVAIDEMKEKPCKMLASCSTDNDFARSFSQWLQSSYEGGKSQKQSDISVTRALKFLKFCCDETGDVEEDLLSAGNLIEVRLDQSEGEVGYWSFGKDSLRRKHIKLVGLSQIQSATGISTSKFHLTEVYVRRARKCLAKDMRVNWTTNLDVETLESRRSWATFSEVQSVIPFHNERYQAVHNFREFRYTGRPYLCHSFRYKLFVPQTQRNVVP